MDFLNNLDIFAVNLGTAGIVLAADAGIRGFQNHKIKKATNLAPEVLQAKAIIAARQGIDLQTLLDAEAAEQELENNEQQPAGQQDPATSEPATPEEEPIEKVEGVVVGVGNGTKIPNFSVNNNQ